LLFKPRLQCAELHEDFITGHGFRISQSGHSGYPSAASLASSSLGEFTMAVQGSGVRGQASAFAATSFTTSLMMPVILKSFGV
jgi:hypothetical protein